MVIVCDNNKNEIYNYMCKELGFQPASTVCFGVVNSEGRLIGGFTFYREGFVCHITAVAKNSSWCTPKTLSELLDIPFDFLRCKIAKFEVSHKNERANRFCKGIGCVKEGLLRFDRHDGTHNIVWSLTRKEILKQGWYKNGKSEKIS